MHTRSIMTLQILTIAYLLALLSGCGSIPTSKPLAPKVSVSTVVPLNLSLTESRLNFGLRVQNPNTFDLPLQNLDFDAYFAGEKIANGSTSQAVTIPAQGEAMMDVEVTAGLTKILSQIKNMFEQQEFELNYNVIGTVKLKNWPARIPFNVDGEFDQSDLKDSDQ